METNTDQLQGQKHNSFWGAILRGILGNSWFTAARCRSAEQLILCKAETGLLQSGNKNQYLTTNYNKIPLLEMASKLI